MKPYAGSYGAYRAAWARNRELGVQPPFGAGDLFAKSLYSSMSLCAQWDALKDSDGLVHGGIFNLEFSPEGSLLVAACEKNSILIIDPLTYKKVYYVHDAHSDCVNFVKFLDSKTFATCSDDTTVALWDVRNLHSPIRTLHGHSNWVKNVEYSAKDKLLVTSGLDGSVYTWDINSSTEWSFVYQRVFHAPGLMRCKISPDANQLVMCTTGGLLIVVHKLNLHTLAQDLHGFRPNMYRLMQMTQQHLPVAAMYNHLFSASRKRNRVEFISDFPKSNDAEVVSSLQIHPQGWCALSRNISHKDKSEWTCVHDIQEDCEVKPPEQGERSPRTSTRITRASTQSRSISTQTCSHPRPVLRSEIRASRNLPHRRPSFVPPARRDTVMSPSDVWEAIITVRQQRIRIELAFRGEARRSFNMQRINGISSGIIVPVENQSWNDGDAVPQPQNNEGSADPLSSGPSNVQENNEQMATLQSRSRRTLLENKKRLLYYTQEPNVGQGFIKELCFSADGRLICSPYGFGVRLLSFNENCSELPMCVPEPDNPKPLNEVWKSVYHDDYVVTARFSPRHFMLATGCLSGRIIWYQPRG